MHAPAFALEPCFALTVDLAFVGFDVTAGVGQIDHRFEVQRVVCAGGADLDLDLANGFVTLVGIGRDLVAETGLAVLPGPACLDILLASFCQRPVGRHGLVGDDFLVLLPDRLLWRVSDARGGHLAQRAI